MRFATIFEALGQQFAKSVLSLIAFCPLLAELSKDVTHLPLIGEMPDALMWAAILWSIFGTVLMAVAGARLPGLEFHNQLVEAAFRKELIMGEDDENRAEESLCRILFSDVRKNYFVIYLHFMYLNVAKFSYLQFDVIFPYMLLVPSICAGSLDMGKITQITNAFGTVTGGFQFLVLSWKTIVELMSIMKRLHAFEAAMGKELGSEDDGSGSSSDDVPAL